MFRPTNYQRYKGTFSERCEVFQHFLSPTGQDCCKNKRLLSHGNISSFSHFVLLFFFFFAVTFTEKFETYLYDFYDTLFMTRKKYDEFFVIIKSTISRKLAVIRFTPLWISTFRYYPGNLLDIRSIKKGRQCTRYELYFFRSSFVLYSAVPKQFYATLRGSRNSLSRQNGMKIDRSGCR